MPINGKDTYYEFFGLTNFEPSQDRIKKAYRSMALKWHPDRHQDKDNPAREKELKEKAEKMFKQVSEIYRVLTTEKRQYDSYLKKKMNPQREESPWASADAWSTAGGSSWSFDFNNIDEMMRRARAQADSEMGQYAAKRQKINQIVTVLERMTFDKLKSVEELIRVFGGL